MKLCQKLACMILCWSIEGTHTRRHFNYTGWLRDKVYRTHVACSPAPTIYVLCVWLNSMFAWEIAPSTGCRAAGCPISARPDWPTNVPKRTGGRHCFEHHKPPDYCNAVNGAAHYVNGRHKRGRHFWPHPLPTSGSQSRQSRSQRCEVRPHSNTDRTYALWSVGAAARAWNAYLIFGWVCFAGWDGVGWGCCG